MVLELSRKVERLTRLVRVLHEAGLIPTHLMLRSAVEAERAEVEREIRGYVDDGRDVPPALLARLRELDVQLQRLSSVG